MSTLRNPVGPQPPSVYWRRRLFVLLGLAAVVAVIVLIIVRPGAGDAGRETPKPTGTPSTAPTEATGDRMCDPAVLDIVPVTDSDSYQSGVQPQISVSITNAGSAPCTLAVEADQLVFSIVSGSDPIWTSSDCLTTPAFEIELQPGTPASNSPIPWDRTRSSADTCSTSRPEVVAGGATYRLGVALGTIEAQDDKAFLLY